MHMSYARLLLATAACALATGVLAQETITYTYDAQGRLVTAASSGTVNNGVSASISYDPAGNRSGYVVTGAGPQPTISISNASVTEGGNLVFTVTKGGTGPASANWTTANGTASSGSDYTAASGTVSFAAGETSKTISIATTDDAVVESAETLTITLSSPSSGAMIGTATGTGTINDNDASFAISNAATITEGGTLVFTVTKTGGTAASFSVNFATANGTAVSGSDYTATSGTLTFAAGEMSKTINVALVNDFTLESAETVLVNLSAPTGGATITTSQGSGTINDDDYAPPSFAISNAAAVNEGGTLVFTVTKTGTTNTSYSVNFATANGTAASGADYTANSGTLTFAAGDTSKTINVATIDETVTEGAETVLVNLSGATGGSTITTSQGSGAINASDPNTPPVANANTLSAPRCSARTVNVIANDTDPDGDYPLTLIGVNKPWAYVANSTTVGMDTPSTNGTYVITYTVQDSRGASSTGTLTVTVSGTNACD